MAPSEREQSERLSRFWDELAGGVVDEPRDLDPALPGTVRQLRALHRPPAIDPVFQHRLGERLLGAPAPPSAVAGPLPLRPVDPAAPALNGRPPDRPWAGTIVRPSRRRWLTSQLATAAVLALVLFGTLHVVRFAQPVQDVARNVLDAAHRPAVETFVDAAVENPSASWTPLVVERWVFQPGGATLSIPPLDGPQWIVAERGGLTVARDGAEQALTAGAGLVISAGQEVVIRNAGAGEASALRGVASVGFALEDYDRAVITRQSALDTEAHPALPPGSSRVVFERLTLLAETTLLLEPATGQDWLAVASGRLGLTLLGDGVPRNWQSGREREVAGGEPLPALPPGIRVTLRNVGEEPLVLLRLRVLPAGTGEGPTTSDERE
jgi:hypothetical protein